jgi:hypothetical protein
MTKPKNINFDAFYVFNYNQKYRLENQDYYREYARNYYLKHKDEMDEYRKQYIKNKTYMKKNKEPIIEFNDGPVRLLFT